LDRKTRLLSSATDSTVILEIGPGYNPVAPKADGWRTHVVDHASREDLRRKYTSANVDVDVIEEVDTIWQGGPLDMSVPQELLGQVDLIIASHVLEHIPDLIGFFKSASLLVVPGGSMSIALPDRRYCFDCFKPWTTTGDLLEAHHRGANTHSLKTLFTQMAYSASMDGQLGWGPGRVNAPVLLDPFEAAADAAAAFRLNENQPYQDCHAWQLTPSSFKLVMLELLALNLTDWRIEKLEGPENFEFFVSLQRGSGARLAPEQLQAERQNLLFSQLAEAREQIDFMLGASTGTGPPQENIVLADLLAAQNDKLREMAETLSWLRAILKPIRRFWHAIHGPIISLVRLTRRRTAQ
jgi:hypothetical protein